MSFESRLGPYQWTRQLPFETLEDRYLLSGDSALTPANPALQAQVNSEYGNLPLSFEANQGQTNAKVDYLTRGSGYALFLTSTGSVLSLQKPETAGAPGAAPTDTSGVALAMNLVGADLHAQVSGLDQLPGASNYLIGNDPSQWQTGLANYGKVEYQDVYSGINLVYYGNQHQLEYDFDVAPGANPQNIRFNVQGADSLSIDDQGNLVIHTGSGDVLEHAPVVYQQIGGSKQTVSGNYVLEGNNQVGFQVGAYDHSQDLVIDPVLSYGTYLGGSNADDSNYGNGIALDSASTVPASRSTLRITSTSVAMCWGPFRPPPEPIKRPPPETTTSTFLNFSFFRWWEPPLSSKAPPPVRTATWSTSPVPGLPAATRRGSIRRRAAVATA